MLNYLRFLAKMGFKHPSDFARTFRSWNRHEFKPNSVAPLPSHPILHCADVEEAARVFARDGFVVLSDGLTPEEAATLGSVVKAKAHDVMKRIGEGVLPPELPHGPQRYSFGDYEHSPEWEYLASNERVLPIIRAIWRGQAFRAVAAGGDFVLPGGTWQTLHNDQGWRGAGEGVPRVLTVNYYVSNVLPTSGPIRQIAGTARFPVPSQVVAKYEPDWMKQSVVTGKPGYVLIRDQRAWHGGTPNTSDEPRYMPNLEYVLRDAPLEDVGGSNVLRQLKNGKWIAEFANS